MIAKLGGGLQQNMRRGAMPRGAWRGRGGEGGRGECESVWVCEYVWVWECGRREGGSKTRDGGRKAGLALGLKCRMELDVAMSGGGIKG